MIPPTWGKLGQYPPPDSAGPPNSRKIFSLYPTFGTSYFGLFVYLANMFRSVSNVASSKKLFEGALSLCIVLIILILSVDFLAYLIPTFLGDHEPSK